MKIEIHVTPVFELSLTYHDIAPVLILCNYHYDSECRSAGAVGGFICGWRDQTGGRERDETVMPEAATCRATRRQLDTLLKCCEGASAATLSRLITPEQEKQVDRLCALVLSALEFSTCTYSKFDPHVLTEPTRRGQLLWSTSPGRR
jgi:hypothetical protein